MSLNKKYYIAKEILVITIIGILIHLFLLNNPIFNYDNIEVVNGYGTGITSGRWALTFLGDLGKQIWGNWNLTYFNNVVFICMMSIASILVAEIYNIRSFGLKIIWGGAVSLFSSNKQHPSVFLYYNLLWYCHSAIYCWSLCFGKE